jgi:hypothetical protein
MAAGSGLTAAVDLTLTRTIVGATSPYTSPSGGAMWCSLYSTQFTAATKAGATEWTTGSDTNYARQALGTGGTNTSGWTINAYASGTGVVITNFATLTQPAPSSSQTLNAVGFCDTVGPTGGNIDLFADLPSPQTVNTGVQVIIAATTGAVFTIY